MRFVDKSTRMMIRLSLRGCTNRPFFLIVVQKNRAPRDRKITEQIGSYDPLPNMYNEKLVAINFDRLRSWLAKGATPSKPVAQLLGLSGFYPIHPSTLLHAARKTRQMEAEQAILNSDNETKEIPAS